MTRTHSLTVRSISLLLAFTFLLSEISYAAPAVSLAVVPVDSLQTILKDPSRFELPAQFAHLQEIHKAESKSTAESPLIIHIQDAHVNLSGQQNLANALDDIMSKYKISLVLVEGGSRDDTLTPIKSVAPPDVWKKVAKKFLIDGKISGEEYLNIISDHPMTIMGIEDKALYMKSLEAYAELAGKREGALEYLKLIQKSLGKLKNKLYPKELLEYEKSEDRGQRTEDRNSEGGYKKLIEVEQSMRHPEGALATEGSHRGEILRFAQNDVFRDFPTVQKLITVQEKENRIDFNLANLEQAALVEEIAKKGGGEDLTSFLEKASQMRDSKLSQYAYFQNTFNIAKDKQIALDKYPNLMGYGQYLKAFSELDMETLLDELERLEDEVYLKLLSNDEILRPARHSERSEESHHVGGTQDDVPKDALLVRSIDRYVHLLQTAYQIQMSTKEFDLFKTNEPDFSTEAYLAFIDRKLAEDGYFADLISHDNRLEEAEKSLEAFYDSVMQRDFAFIKNTEKLLKQENQKAAVLISGGYHTPHLKKLFKEKNYSYIVLSPIVTSETNQAKYEKLLLEPIKKSVQTITVSEDSRQKTVDRKDKALSSLEDDLIKLKKKNDGARQQALAEALNGARLAELAKYAADAAGTDPATVATQILQFQINQRLSEAQPKNLIAEMEAEKPVIASVVASEVEPGGEAIS